MNEFELTGRASTHIVELAQPRCALHYEAAASFLAMRDSAQRDGIELVARSSFRDFDTQLTIWNAKWSGERPMYDRLGRPLERRQLADSQAVDAILCWSAIPGGSRHHWGSDVDVIDTAVCRQAMRCSSSRRNTHATVYSAGCPRGWTRTWSASVSSGPIARTAAA